MFSDNLYETDRLSKYLNSHTKVLEQNKKIEVMGLFTSEYLEDYPRSFGQKVAKGFKAVVIGQKKDGN